MTFEQLITCDITGPLQVGTKALKVAAASLLVLTSRVLWRGLYETGPAYGKAAQTADRLWCLSRQLVSEIETVKEQQ